LSALCLVSLEGEPIPEKHKEFYGNTTHFSRRIGIEVQGIYDGVLYYKCPDCGWAWQRFTSKWFMEMAQKFIDQNNANHKTS
jgi:hypothetical protein